jgi:hypothetical protein
VYRIDIIKFFFFFKSSEMDSIASNLPEKDIFDKGS